MNILQINRLAVFVEGYTEVVFVKKLIEEIADDNNVQIEHWQVRGGSNTRRAMQLKARQPNTGQRYFVLIMDCGGDVLVKDRIREEHENLNNKGYSKIIGIRDVRPTFDYSEIPILEANLPKYIKTSLIPVEFVLAIMETEAWFLAEASHFSKVNPAITVDRIKNDLGFDPENDDMEQRSNPADDLNDCYAIGGEQYDKQKIENTINKLDFTIMYEQFGTKFKYFDRLLNSINTFLS